MLSFLFMILILGILFGVLFASDFVCSRDSQGVKIGLELFPFLSMREGNDCVWVKICLLLAAPFCLSLFLFLLCKDDEFFFPFSEELVLRFCLFTLHREMG